MPRRERISNGESMLRALELITRNAFLTEADEAIALRDRPPAERSAPCADVPGTVVTVAFDYDEEGQRRYRYWAVSGLPETPSVPISRDEAATLLNWKEPRYDL